MVVGHADPLERAGIPSAYIRSQGGIHFPEMRVLKLNRNWWAEKEQNKHVLITNKQKVRRDG